MKRLRKMFVVFSLTLALTAVPAAPALAGPAEDVVCDVTTELGKYNWGVMPVCL